MWRYNPHSYATRKKRYVIAIDKLHIVFSFFICFDDPFVFLFQLQPIEPLFCGKTTLRLFFKFLKESVDAGISLFPSIRDSFILNELKVKQMERPKFPLPDGVFKVTNPLTRGTAVKQIQTALAALYFYPDKGTKNNGVDGVYGPKTANAVKRFQSVNGLTVDGIYGPKTKAKIEEKLKDNRS